jgi:hypothetical protein
MAFYVRHYDHSHSLIEGFRPENLHFTLNKKGIHTVQYERSHAAGVSHDFVGAYRTDFELDWEDPVTSSMSPIVYGMHVPAPTTEKGSGFTTIYGKDWKHYLERRHYPFNPLSINQFDLHSPMAGYAIYRNADVAAHIKDLLDQTLGMANSLAITYPTLTTNLGIPVDFQLAHADSTTILTFIDQLSGVDPGFDYDILTTKELRLYSPHKYNILVASNSAYANYIFDSSNANLITDGPTFANNGPLATHWLGLGSGVGDGKMGVALGYSASQAVYRRLDQVQDYSEVKKASDLRLRAMKDFSFALNPQHEITFSVQAEKIANFWVLFRPGEAIWLDSELTSHQIQSGQEIVQMDCVADGSGGCTVSFGLNQIYTGTAGVDQA